MLLTRHSGVTVELERVVYGDLQGATPFKWEETPSAGYTDVSSITNWDLFGSTTGGDYKALRAGVQALYVAAGWAALSAVEREVCARLFVATPAERLEIYSADQQVVLGQVFHASSVGARRLRIAAATSEVYNRLAKAEADIVIDDVNGLLSKYEAFGREGTMEGDSEGLFDYVEARAGTSFAATGFAAKTWAPIGHADMAAFAVALMRILRDGVY